MPLSHTKFNFFGVWHWICQWIPNTKIQQQEKRKKENHVLYMSTKAENSAVLTTKGHFSPIWRKQDFNKLSNDLRIEVKGKIVFHRKETPVKNSTERCGLLLQRMSLAWAAFVSVLRACLSQRCPLLLTNHFALCWTAPHVCQLPDNPLQIAMLYSAFGSGVSPSNNATGGAVEVKKKKKKKKKKVHKRVKTFPVPGTDFWFIQQCRGVCLLVCLFSFSSCCCCC